MSNLVKKTLPESTVFQFGMIVIGLTFALYWADGIKGSEVVTVLMAVFATYAAKEGIAKGAEAYRDKGAK